MTIGRWSPGSVNIGRLRSTLSRPVTTARRGYGGLAPLPARGLGLLADLRGPVGLGVGRAGRDEDDVGHRPEGSEHHLVPLAPETAGDAVDDGGAVHRGDHVDQHVGPVGGGLRGRGRRGSPWGRRPRRARAAVGARPPKVALRPPLDRHRPCGPPARNCGHNPGNPQAAHFRSTGRFLRVRALQHSGRNRRVGVRGPGGSGRGLGRWWLTQPMGRGNRTASYLAAVLQQITEISFA